jgi:ethylmalonyl-CoA/methylmalonyl-CoA decarboxylase
MFLCNTLKCNRYNVIISRKLVSLGEKHKEFLSCVCNHVEGSIEYNDISSKFTNGVGILGEIVINNPNKKNAISGKMMMDLSNILDDLLIKRNNTTTKPLACIIRNIGTSSFCSGADLNLVKEVVNTPERGYLMSLYMTDALNRLRQSDIITITAINGKAIGGGAELTTVSDFRIMSDDIESYICFIHAKLGAAPGFGGTSRLFSILGRKKSLKLLGTSVKIDAKTALDMDFIDDIFPKDATHELIISQSLKILKPYLDQEFPESVRAIKKTIANCDSISPNDINLNPISTKIINICG